MQGGRACAAGLGAILFFLSAGCGDAPPAGPAVVCEPCGDHASCVAADDGRGECRCDAGYQGDGKLCEAVGECGSDCDAHAWCLENASGDPVCKCAAGYAGNGRQCSPVVAASDCNGCDAHATCLAVDAGVFECRCDPGYVGSGKTCQAPASCGDDHGGCHPRATCTEVSGQITCACAHGFQGDGYTCVPPVGGYVKVAGQLSLDYATAHCTGQAVWNFDLRFAGKGARFATPGKVTTGVWEAESTVDFIDFDTGEITLDFAAHTWLEHDCPGRIDFLWANAQDGERTWINVPGNAELSFFGEGIPWYWSASGVTVSNVQSTLVATFEKP